MDLKSCVFYCQDERFYQTKSTPQKERVLEKKGGF